MKHNPAKWVPEAEDSLVIAERQRKNPVVQHLREVTRVWADILPDFLVGPSTGVVYISLHHHRLHHAKEDSYLWNRLDQVWKHYKVTIVLCLIDISDSEKWLIDVTKLAFKYSAVLFPAWSTKEAAKVLQSFRIYSKKNAADFLSAKPITNATNTEIAAETLTTIPTVARVDAISLLSHFGNLRKVLLVSNHFRQH